MGNMVPIGALKSRHRPDAIRVLSQTIGRVARDELGAVIVLEIFRDGSVGHEYIKMSHGADQAAVFGLDRLKHRIHESHIQGTM